MIKAKRMSLAVIELSNLIENGWEFPDAVWKVTQKYSVNSEQLESLYDEEKQQ